MPRALRPSILISGVAAAAVLAGCGEQPDPHASRPPRATTPAQTGGGDGGSQSTLGRARDFAEGVIEDAKEMDRERMRIMDEMDGRETSESSQSDSDADSDAGGS